MAQTAGERPGRWPAEAVSAAVGAGLGAVLLVLARLPWNRFDPGGCRERGGWACLGYFLLLELALPPVVTLVGWAALRLAGVRPAGRVAFAAGVLCFGGVHLGSAVLPAGMLWALPVLFGAGYALAAWLVVPGRAGRWPRVAVLVGLVLLWPLVGAVAELQGEARHRDGLARVTVPLLESHGGRVTEDELKHLAATLQVRSAARFG